MINDKLKRGTCPALQLVKITFYFAERALGPLAGCCPLGRGAMPAPESDRRGAG